MRGMWGQLPVNPTASADRLKPFFLPSPKQGFITKGRSFAFARKVEKAVERELKNVDQQVGFRSASRYAVLRAALTLYHEVHAWDDSYGVISDRGVEWLREVLSIKPPDIAADSEVFLKDLVMFLCWENYGLSGLDAIADYVCRLQPHDARLAIQILKDIHHRASQGFQIYKAETATRALKKLETVRILPKLTLVRPTQALNTELS
jgi:hypothetical protein